MSAGPVRVGASLDLVPEVHDATVAFWSAVSGAALSPARDAHLRLQRLQRLQRLGDGDSAIHLDLHVADPRATADAACARGATEVRASDDGDILLTSPGGLPFLVVGHPGSQVTPEPAPAALWPDGHRSAVDQVCVDAGPRAYDAEAAFWSATLDRPLQDSRIAAEFASLEAPEGQAVRVLLQRLTRDTPAVTAHLDLACDDRPTEVRRHVGLGATVRARYPAWTVLTDPAGLAYCITDRDPVTGRVAR